MVAANRILVVVVCTPVCDFDQAMSGYLICDRAYGATATLCSTQLLFVGCEAGTNLGRLVGSQ